MVQLPSIIKFQLESPSEKYLIYFFVFGLCGFVLYFISGSLAFFIGKQFNCSSDTLGEFFRQLGIAFIISAILAIVLERLTHVILLKKIEEAVTELKTAPRVLKGASELGIENIFARRDPHTNQVAENTIHDIIEKQIAQKKGEIRLLVVAAPDYFRLGNRIGNLFSHDLADKNVNCKLKVLLLDKNSEWAKLRGNLEDPHPTILHIEESINYLNNLMKEPNLMNKIEYRLYDAPPVAFLIITEQTLILEPYPIIKVNLQTAPIGGWTPMMVIKRNNDNETYRRWRNHFDYLWDVCDPAKTQHRYF
jgi:hypothetical protein